MNTQPPTSNPSPSPSPQSQQPESIRQLFGSIASTYDRANDVITLGLARQWRRQLVRWSDIRPGDRVLDCATGTGDLALAFKKAVGDEGLVVGSDFCQEMLNLAAQKANRHRLSVGFEWADATLLPYESNSFDVVSIAYGLRNIEDRPRALSEMARVAKPGGRLMILETGSLQGRWWHEVMDWYTGQLMPRLGGWISGRPDAYRYLNQSSRHFPSGEDLTSMIMATGAFQGVKWRTLLGGASFLYRAVAR